MPYVELRIPAGLVEHGTDSESVGRWREANLVRWERNSLRPVGGWAAKVDTGISYAPRGAHAWRSNSGGRYLALGDYAKLYAVVGSTAFDITPVGFTSGRLDGIVNIGFGASLYGTGAYGVQRLESNVAALPASVWSLDNWGEYLVGCCDTDGKLYEWQLNTATPAAVIANAPTDNRALVVTEERFIFALGAGGNPRLVQWCDREDNTTWTPTSTNEAGDLELQTAGEIQCALRTRGRTLILTTLDAHVAAYQGPPTVYGFERVSDGCGAASRLCAVDTPRGVFWMGRNDFFFYDGSAVSPMPCDVKDAVFNDINRTQISKVAAVNNRRNGEVWWFYASESSNENDSYVMYSYNENYWMKGRIVRTCGVDSGVFQNPLWAGADTIVYEHEVGLAKAGSQPFAETGPIQIGAGEQVARVIEMIPDEITQGNMDVRFKAKFYPNDVERSYGPFNPANPTSVRFTGREFTMRVTFDELTNSALGTIRLDVKAGGRR